MAEPPIYDTIGKGYASQRRADPRIAAQILEAVGDARTVLNVGAGTGNYEPTDRPVVALEPSIEMLAQRTNGNPAVRGVAEALPFPDGAFDCTLGTFTVHHWEDRLTGLREVARVSRRQVLLVYEPVASSGFWLAEYFPGIALAPWEGDAPTVDTLAQVLTVTESQPIRVPPDCTDGFMGAYWCRPEYYLRHEVHRSISSLAILDHEERRDGIARLAADLESGVWERRNGQLLDEPWFDLGYRLAVCAT
ncbi:MAG: class I SAM-dependent methyltransferase [Actinomycetota bacterium]